MSDLLRDRVIVAIGDHYDIDREIGRGAMGVVYRALDLRLRRTVAVKVLPPDLAFRPEVRTRFLREAEMAAQLSHPNIVPIYSVDERGGIVHFVMAMVEGESLADRLARERRPALAFVRRVLHDVADALAFAHSRGVVHRDIKPDNILLDRYNDRPVVTDFGIARAAEEGARLTVTGVAVGTPAYMSPEQATGERELDGRSDVYSLGIVGYQMMAGVLPFAAGSSAGMMLKHLSEMPVPMAARRPDAPPGLVAVVERALAKRPEDRWQDAGMMRDAVLADADTQQMRAHGSRSAGARAVAPVAAPPPVLLEPSGEPISGGRGRKKRKHEDSLEVYAAKPLEERIRIARRDVFVGGIGLVAFTAVNAATWPWLWWTVFPAFFIGATVVRRLGSLWGDGIPLRDVFSSSRVPRGDAVDRLPSADALATGDALTGPQGQAIRRAAEDRAQIMMIVKNLAPADRELLPDIGPTVDALVERTAALAQMLHRLDADVGVGSIERIDTRIAEVEQEPESAPDRERRLGLLQRQRTTLTDLAQRRGRVAHQLESATLALQNLRLDLLKLRSSGVQAALRDVQSATQEARALSRDIGHVLAAAEEVRKL